MGKETHRAAWILAEGAIILAACGLLLWRCGAGFLCVEIAIVGIGLGLVTAVTQSVTRFQRKLPIHFALVGFLAILAVGFTFYKTSSGALFREYVADPIPSTLRILDSEYQGGRDSATYLHFQLGPGDIETILQNRSYKSTSDIHGPGGYDPLWWKPQTLTNATTYNWRDPNDQHSAWLWVNETKTEAYFTYWNF